MIRKLVLLAALVALAVTVVPALTSARPSHSTRSTIKGAEAGYFGTGRLAHKVWVFVYTSAQPRAGTTVKVCMGNVCHRARGHAAKVAWYVAEFSSPPLLMGAPVSYRAYLHSRSGNAKLSATSGLLCMHNNGSTPQHS